MQKINNALTNGNRAIELLKTKNEQIVVLNNTISTQAKQLELHRQMTNSQQNVVKLVSAERDAYKIVNTRLITLSADQEKTISRETRRKKNWRTVAIGSTTITVGIVAVIYLLK